MIQNTALAFSRPNPALAARLREAMATRDRRWAETMGVPTPANDDDVDAAVADLEALLAPALADFDAMSVRPAPPAQPIKVRNFVNGRTRSKPANDAHFAQEGLAPVLDAAAVFSAKASVGYPAPALSPSASPATRAFAEALGNIAGLRIADPLKDVLRDQARREHELHHPAPKTKPASRWFTSAHAVQPAKQARPASWYALCDEARVEWFQAAITRLGPTMAATVNLRADVEADALAQPSAASYLLKRLRHHLKKELGRDVSIEFVLEQTTHGRLHLHGVVGISEKEALRARRAMRKACGEFVDRKSRQFQAKTRAEVDGGWAGYVSKDLPLARPFQRELFKGDRHRARRFQGEAIAATQDVRRLAKRLYDDARAKFLGVDKAPSSKSQPPFKHRLPSNLMDAWRLRSSTYLTAPSNTVTTSWSTHTGKFFKWRPSTSSPTPSMTTWSKTSSTRRPALVAQQSFAVPASPTTWSSLRLWITPRSTATPSSSRSPTPAACCRSAWPWTSSRTKRATGAWSSRGPPSGA